MVEFSNLGYFLLDVTLFCAFLGISDFEIFLLVSGIFGFSRFAFCCVFGFGICSLCWIWFCSLSCLGLDGRCLGWCKTGFCDDVSFWIWLWFRFACCFCLSFLMFWFLYLFDGLSLFLLLRCLFVYFTYVWCDFVECLYLYLIDRSIWC